MVARYSLPAINDLFVLQEPVLLCKGCLVGQEGSSSAQGLTDSRTLSMDLPIRHASGQQRHLQSTLPNLGHVHALKIEKLLKHNPRMSTTVRQLQICAFSVDEPSIAALGI